MPMNKNALIRYQVIDELLANYYHPRTRQELLNAVNERLSEMGCKGVGIRCIQKDISYLQHCSSWNVEIEEVIRADRDVLDRNHTSVALRYSDPNFTIFKIKLTSDEKYLLSEVMKLLEAFEGMPELDGLQNLRKSLGISQQKQIIQIDKNPLNNDDGALLCRLFKAITKEWTIKLHYHKFDSLNVIRTVDVYPYLIKEYNNRWYLFCGAVDTNKILNFAFDRIDLVEPVENLPYKPYNGDFEDRFSDIIGVSFDEKDSVKTEKITFWVSDFSKEYIKSKPLHESQTRCKNYEQIYKQYPTLKGGDFYTIEVQNNFELIRELSSFGDNLLVISPQNIQNEIHERIKRMDMIYSILRT